MCAESPATLQHTECVLRTEFQQVVLVDNRVLKSESKCISASKDLQTISSVIALNYRVSNSKSAELYKNVGVDYQNTIITPTIQDSVKAITAKLIG